MAVFQAPWIQYVASLPDCNFTVTQNPLTATFTHPGLNYTAFDRDARISIHILMSYIVDVRFFAESYPCKEKQDRWFHWGTLSDEILFMSSTQFILSRNMYNDKVPKWPLKVKVALAYVGKSSITFSVELCSSSSQEPLLTHLVQMVRVDKKTRKSKLHPDWFMKKYEGQNLMETGFRLETFSRPARTFLYRREVLRLETDSNNHTNYASYVRYAIDGIYLAIQRQTAAAVTVGGGAAAVTVGGGAAAETVGGEAAVAEGLGTALAATAANSSQQASNLISDGSPVPAQQTKNNNSTGLKDGARDIVKDGLKSLNVRYVNECVEGDVVDVHVWQDDNDAYIFRCSIDKGSKVLCQLTLEYFTPVAKL